MEGNRVCRSGYINSALYNISVEVKVQLLLAQPTNLTWTEPLFEPTSNVVRLLRSSSSSETDSKLMLTSTEPFLAESLKFFLSASVSPAASGGSKDWGIGISGFWQGVGRQYDRAYWIS